MKPAGYADFAVAAFAGASSFLAAGAADASAKAESPQHRHDGIYAVHIVTQHGSCRNAYNTTIAVKGSQVAATGHALLRASGHIAAGGGVSLKLRLLHHAAHIAGRIRGHSGSGKWSSESLACGGHWHATRQS